MFSQFFHKIWDFAFKARSIDRVFLISMLFVSVISISIPTYVWMYRERSKQIVQVQEIRDVYFERQKFIIKDEVTKVVDYIDYQRERNEIKFRDELRMLVNEQYEVMMNLYNKYKGISTKKDLKQIIKEALRPVKLNISAQTICVGSMAGDVILYQKRTAIENTNIIDMKDDSGFYAIRSDIELLRKKKEGFTVNYWYHTVHYNRQVYPKTSYIKYFEPFDWYIAVGSYLIDSEEDLKMEIVDRYSKIRFNNNVGIFIDHFDGNSLLRDGKKNFDLKSFKNYEDPDGKKVWELVRSIANKIDGEFIEYQWFKNNNKTPQPKLSYVYGYQSWNWIIGAGVFIEDIENQVVKLGSKTQIGVNQKLTEIALLFLFSVIVAFVIAKFLSLRVRNSFKVFNSFFEQAATNSITIDDSTLSFLEFKQLSQSANGMIQKRKTVEHALSGERSLLAHLIDSIPDIIFFKDTESRFLGCNTAFTHFVGRRFKEIIGKTEFELFDAERANSYIESDKLLLSNHIPQRSIQLTTFPDGKQFIYETLKNVYYDTDGNVLGIIGVSRDITETKQVEERLQKAKERAEQADKLKSVFLSNMSHEIRTPLNAILGFSDLLADKNITAEEIEEYVSIIRNSGKHLLNLVNDIIDISLLETHQIELYWKNIKLKNFLETYQEFFEQKIVEFNKKNIDFVIEIETIDEEFELKTDDYRLEQIISHLIENAIKFTEKGRIVLSCTKQVFENEQLIFSIKDSGSGIAPEKQHLLFTLFTKIEYNKNKFLGGTGLGLAISKRILDLFGGKIWVESKLGEGTTFSFSIPLKNSSK